MLDTRAIELLQVLFNGPLTVTKDPANKAHWDAELLKRRIPLLDYLLSQDWQPTRRIARGRLMGVCPLHADRKPSFLVERTYTILK